MLCIVKNIPNIDSLLILQCFISSLLSIIISLTISYANFLIIKVSFELCLPPLNLDSNFESQFNLVIHDKLGI